MPRSMYVNVVNEEESRIAIVEDGLLEELSIETSHDDLIEGNLYKARVEKVLPGLDAVFVDFGREKNGFIALSEVRSEYFANGDRKPDNLKRGRDLLVQVKKGEIGTKGAALTTYISIPGRFLVLMPFVDKRGVSKQIEDDAKRKMLKEAIAETALPDGMGYIVRTAAEDQKKQDIQRDVMFLLRMWKRISTLYEKAEGPALVYREGDLVIRTIRDYFSPEMKELLVDDPKVFEKVSAFFKSVMPWHAKKVKLYDGRAPLFTKHNLEAQIASIHEEKVKLPSGGSIVIQQTEALVSVDVNSGAGSKNKDIESTALVTNMEAAAEVARQLRLRDMGGLIVVDFIDMRNSANQAAVKKELLKVLKGDKAQTDIGSISKFGLLELSRQRLRRASGPKITSACPLCGGSGKLRSTESFALIVLRTIQSVLAKHKYPMVNVGVGVDSATFLFNRKRKQIAELEEMFATKVDVYSEPGLLPNHYYINFVGEKTRTETNVPADYPIENLKCRTASLPQEAKAYTGASYDALSDFSGDEEEFSPAGNFEVPDEPPTEKPEQPKAAKPQEKKGRQPKKKPARGGAAVKEAPQPLDISEISEFSQPLSQEKPEKQPEQPQQKAKQPQQQPASTSGEALTPSQKRRRRRKKKKLLQQQVGGQQAGATTEPAAQPNAAEPPSPRAEISAQVREEAPEPASFPDEDSLPSENGEQKAKKPARRRSRRKPKTAKASGQEQASEAAPMESQPPAPAEEPAATGDAAKPAKKRPSRRRRPRRKPGTGAGNGEGEG